jgi:hypothetical protein
MPFRLRMVFRDPADEYLIVERLPALVDDNDRRIAIEPLFDPVEQVEHGRRAADGVVEHAGHVEPDRPGIDVGPVGLIVEQPGPLALAPPGTEPGMEVGGMRPMPAAEQVDQIAQLPELDRLGVTGVDRVTDVGRSSALPPGQHGEQSIRNGGWPACRQLRGLRPDDSSMKPVVAAADRGTNSSARSLSKKMIRDRTPGPAEAEDHRLAGARRSDHRELPRSPT